MTFKSLETMTVEEARQQYTDHRYEIILCEDGLCGHGPFTKKGKPDKRYRDRCMDHVADLNWKQNMLIWEFGRRTFRDL